MLHRRRGAASWSQVRLPLYSRHLCGLPNYHNVPLSPCSHEDNFPASVTGLPVVTGQKTAFTTAGDVDRQVSSALANGDSLYTLDVEKIKELRPDVILTQVAGIPAEVLTRALSPYHTPAPDRTFAPCAPSISLQWNASRRPWIHHHVCCL